MSALPIDEVLPTLRRHLAEQPAVVLQAPPGAGKTTGVPPALLGEPWLRGQHILMLEPRRLAARAAAARMAEMLGEALGETVGYRIRFESRVSARTRIHVLTEGVLTRRLQSDPALEGVGLVIFDEFHERHLESDLALALCRDAQLGLREDLKLLVMSATLDATGVAKLLNNAPLVVSEGRSYPVDIEYLARDVDGPLAPAVARVVGEALDKHAGDVLVFLPGAAEIHRAEELLGQNLKPATVDVVPLYGGLSWDAQQRALRPGARRRVVLATPIAETSLTIEGVRVVVDAGYARVPQFDPSSGLTRLHTQRIARASADQRAGRAGRLAPGVCYRLWSETTQRGLVAHPTPEIRGADLASLVLELAVWGVQDAQPLNWMDAPPAAAWAQARELLHALDALDADGRLTPSGRAMAQLPVHPRLAHMLISARSQAWAAHACDGAALLGERDVLRDPSRRSVDFSERVEALWQYRRGGRSAAQARAIDVAACERVEREAAQYRRLLGDVAPANEEPAALQVGLLLSLAYPDRVAQQRAPKESRYVLAQGRGARLPQTVSDWRPAYLVAVRLDAASGEGVIQLAAPVDAQDLRTHLAEHVREVDRVEWDAQQAAVVAQREERFGELVLRRVALAQMDAERLRAAMLTGIRQLGVQALPWTDDARALQARILSMRAWFAQESWPDVSDAGLTAALEEWLGPFLDGVTRRDHLARIDVAAALRARLDWVQQRRLDDGAPTHVLVPSGARHRIEYRPGESPVLAVKLQEMFGLADTPRVAFGRVPVTLHLLSPARRPIQVTQDLRGFWERTYAEVKKELKGRYPKHPWPDDPWQATPTARTKRRTP